MILYTNGCSWTWGHGEQANLSSREKRESMLWPHFLGEKLQAEKVVNNSTGCGSNQRIVRTTFEWLRTLDPNDYKKVVAVIQFTEMSRFEFYLQKHTGIPYENFEDRWINCKVNAISGSFIPNYLHDTIINDANKRLSYTTPIEDLYNFLTHVNALTNVFKTYNISNVFYWNHNNFIWLPKEYKDYFYKNFPFISEDERWEYSRHGYVINSDGSKGYDDHPSMPEGHKELASIIFKHLPVKDLWKKMR